MKPISSVLHHEDMTRLPVTGEVTREPGMHKPAIRKLHASE